MPQIIDPNNSGSLASQELGHGEDYTYPSLSDGTRLDFSPSSELSRFVCTEVMKRATVSSARIKDRESTWQELDDVRNVYISLNDAETLAQQKDKRRPVPIIIPAMAASVETILTYILDAVGAPPAFKYIGSGPEDAVGALLLERYIEWQFNRYRHILALITQWRDSLIYGFGAVAPSWRVKFGDVKQTIQNPMINFSNGTQVLGAPFERISRGVVSEGHELCVIDPRNFLWDTNVCEYDLQKGEYAGFINRSNYISVLRWEQDSNGAVFNARYLRRASCLSSLTSDGTNMRTGERTYSDGSQSDVTKPVDVIHMYIDLIPKDWKLSSWEYPQKWYFAVAGDSVVLAAAPLEYKHDLFPIAVCAPDFDGHTGLSLSRAELIYPMQHHLNWYINSLNEAQLKDLGGTTVYDPSVIYEPDLLKKGPMKLVRLRKPMWGKDARTSIFPVQGSTVGMRNLGDANYMLDMMQRVGGASDAMQGMQRVGGERVTALEINKISSGSAGRMRMMARIIGAQSMQDLAFLLASQSQQKMTRSFYAAITGRGEEYLRLEYEEDQYVKVSPADIDVNIDIVPIDGSIATGENVAGWSEFSKTLLANPIVMQELYQKWDVVRVLKHTLREMGMKNTEEFERRGPPPRILPQVMSDEAVMAEKQAGNIIQMKGLGNAGA